MKARPFLYISPGIFIGTILKNDKYFIFYHKKVLDITKKLR